MAQTLRGDLTTHQEADLIDLLAEKVSHGLQNRHMRSVGGLSLAIT